MTELHAMEQRLNQRMDTKMDEITKTILTAMGAMDQRLNQRIDQMDQRLDEKIGEVMIEIRRDRASKAARNFLDSQTYMQNLRDSVWRAIQRETFTSANVQAALKQWCKDEQKNDSLQAMLIGRSRASLPLLVPLIVAVNTLPSAVKCPILFRGVEVRGDMEAFMQKYSVGNLVLETAFIASSYEIQEAARFLPALQTKVLFVLLAIDPPMLDIFPSYTHPEHEVLIPPGSLWRVKEHLPSAFPHTTCVLMQQIAFPATSLHMRTEQGDLWKHDPNYPGTMKDHLPVPTTPFSREELCQFLNQPADQSNIYTWETWGNTDTRPPEQLIQDMVSSAIPNILERTPTHKGK
eukprot:TRINITY_DN45639_c0_g1_i2.p1 TRINITY_DN45639_c0_g1~~TRINITY_DN45639_c0_g1_i2.p1  ORF type:complete len:349 (+),score=4.15 TRINITY_DN45639_c0_g1_i2:51-1097(+)